MINFITHPALTNLLEQSRVKMKYLRSLVDMVIVSSFLQQHTNSIHSGLLEAVKYRLARPAHYILLLSFHSKEELLLHDTFGILSLEGTAFIRLPFAPEQLYFTIDQYIDNELTIPNKDWEAFATNACTALLKEKINLLKHGNKLDFINNITGPLRASVVSMTEYPELLPVMKKQLAATKCYIDTEEITELFSLANAGASLPDTFLQFVLQFTNGLQQLEMYATQEEINMQQLITEIDILNETSLKIQNN